MLSEEKTVCKTPTVASSQRVSSVPWPGPFVRSPGAFTPHKVLWILTKSPLLPERGRGIRFDCCRQLCCKRSRVTNVAGKEAYTHASLEAKPRRAHLFNVEGKCLDVQREMQMITGVPAPRAGTPGGQGSPREVRTPGWAYPPLLPKSLPGASVWRMGWDFVNTRREPQRHMAHLLPGGRPAGGEGRCPRSTRQAGPAQLLTCAPYTPGGLLGVARC